MGKREVNVTITGKDETKGAFASAEKNASGFGASMKGLLNPLNLLKGAVAGLGLATLGNFLKSSVQSALGAEESWSRLASAVSNLGLNAEDVRPQLDGIATSIERTTRFADDAVQGALSQLISISGDYGKSLENINLVTDLAVAKKMDLESAAQLVGKAMVGETGTLARYGIVVEEGADAVEEMRKRFDGFATNDRTAWLHQLASGWDNIKEAIGRAVIGDGATPGMSAFSEALNDVAAWIDENSGSIRSLANDVAALGSAIDDVAKAAKSLWNSPWNVGARHAERLFRLARRLSGGEEMADPESAGLPSSIVPLRNGAFTDAQARTARERAKREAEAAKAREKAAKEATRDADRDARDYADRVREAVEATTPTGGHMPLSNQGGVTIGSDNATRGRIDGIQASPMFELPPADVVEGFAATFAVAMGDVKAAAEDAAFTLADAWGSAFELVGEGAISVGEAITQSVRKGIAGAVRAKGAETMLDAGKALAEGFTNPAKLLQAAKLFTIGAGYYALAGVLGGGGGGGGSRGGGGGGISSAGMSSAQSEVAGAGAVTLVFHGKQTTLDHTDPDALDNFADMFKAATGTRRVEVKVIP